MDISVPSRFACLKIEDDDQLPKSKVKETKQKTDKKQLKKGEKDRKDVKSGIAKQQFLSTTAKKNKKKAQPIKQWEEWKQKDSELVNGHFEEDLHNAIMLSKLEYEEKKDIYVQQQNEADRDKALNKKKKNKAMSLDQFLHLGVNENGANKNNLEDIKSENDVKEDFFSRIQIEAKEQLTKEQLLEERKERNAKIDEYITISQYQQKLEKEKAKNVALKLELEKAKAEIIGVKARNKTLCGILGHGEMKDKADVLLELERLNIVKNDLTEEVTRLHGLLEQERSKVAALGGDQHNKHKDKKHRKHAV